MVKSSKITPMELSGAKESLKPIDSKPIDDLTPGDVPEKMVIIEEESEDQEIELTRIEKKTTSSFSNTESWVEGAFVQYYNQVYSKVYAPGYSVTSSDVVSIVQRATPTANQASPNEWTYQWDVLYNYSGPTTGQDWRIFYYKTKAPWYNYSGVTISLPSWADEYLLGGYQSGTLAVGQSGFVPMLADEESISWTDKGSDNFYDAAGNNTGILACEIKVDNLGNWVVTLYNPDGTINQEIGVNSQTEAQDLCRDWNQAYIDTLLGQTDESLDDSDIVEDFPDYPEEDEPGIPECSPGYVWNEELKECVWDGPPGTNPIDNPYDEETGTYKGWDEGHWDDEGGWEWGKPDQEEDGTGAGNLPGDEEFDAVGTIVDNKETVAGQELDTLPKHSYETYTVSLADILSGTATSPFSLWEPDGSAVSGNIVEVRGTTEFLWSEWNSFRCKIKNKCRVIWEVNHVFNNGQIDIDPFDDEEDINETFEVWMEGGDELFIDWVGRGEDKNFSLILDGQEQFDTSTSSHGTNNLLVATSGKTVLTFKEAQILVAEDSPPPVTDPKPGDECPPGQYFDAITQSCELIKNGNGGGNGGGNGNGEDDESDIAKLAIGLALVGGLVFGLIYLARRVPNEG